MVYIPLLDAERQCSRCGEVKTAQNFHRATRGRDGLRSHCKSCHTNHKGGSPEARRAAELRRKYGLTLEDYAAMLAGQGGVCAICGTETPAPHRTNFYVDHDHGSGRVRGLLCANCNTTLGLMDDDPSLLRAAAEYLEAIG